MRNSIIEGLPSIDRLNARLDSSERHLRQALMNGIIDCGQPLCEDELALLPELAGFDFGRSYLTLIEKQLLVNDDGKVLFVYPVSALPTQHRVRLADGRRFHAMCAIDAMGSASVFQQDVEISSRCAFCDVPMELAIREGEITSLDPPEAHVLHVDLTMFSDWSGNC